MKEITYLIIGGGVAGTTAANTLRKEDPVSTIAIISDEPYRLYSRLMISKPNYVLGKISPDSLWLKKENWYQEQNIEFMLSRRVMTLDPTQSIVTLDDGSQIKYQKLLLAVGGKARHWGIPGSDKKGITYLRTLDDAKKVYEEMKTAKKAISIGSGFISFEICETLKMAGIDVTLVMREPYYWYPLFDEETGKIIEDAMIKGGINIIRNAEVADIKGGEKLTGVTLKDGQSVDCDLAVVGIGLDFGLEWLKLAGVAIGRGILANEYLETNIQNIFTAGDIAEFKDIILGEQIQLGNWVNAQNQGRVSALNMIGKKQPFRMVSFYTAQAFGITISFVGDACQKPDRQAIIRKKQGNGAITRIMIKDGEIIGAMLINSSSDLSVISKLIEKDIKVSDKLAELADPTFNLSTLIPV